MSDFEKYIEAKYPNRSPKILFQKFKDIDGTLFYGIKEVEDQAEAWNHQQAIIDEHTEVIKLQDADLRKYEKQIESLKAQLNNMEACYIEKKKQVEELQARANKALSVTGNYCDEDDAALLVFVLEKALRGES
ncbi:hypothetical protein [Acinetobacter johnsonii]|uniref:hypothetical protein n=1 Tax=Acinetobacter johnsonii TaxID=40214 RepID=UPI003AF898B3